MKQICLQCERTSLDKNLYCQETDCPAEMSPTILDYGEWVGDIEIVKPISVLRSSVLYEAIHQKQKVLLKVAHPGVENKERLKREAEFLRSYRGKNKFLPLLLPPYAKTTIKHDPYGKVMLQGHLLYFCLFEFVEGEPLRDILAKNPQLWINHVGWVIISLANAVNFLHTKNLYHCGLNPGSALVRFDDELPNAPRLLLFDLGIISTKQDFSNAWYPFAVPPAYTAPELLTSTNHSISASPHYQTDVYGLGLVLYEMLIGEPTYPYKLRSDDEVSQAVRRDSRVKMNRIEDVKMIASLANQATFRQADLRQPTVVDLAKPLRKSFGKVPEVKKSRIPTLQTILVVVGALLAIAFLLTFAVTMGSFV